MRWRIRIDDSRPGSPAPNVTLRTRDRYGDFVEVKFKVDTGADCSAMTAAMARDLGISFTQANEGTAAGLVGRVKKYRGELHIWLGGVVYALPCDFTETPEGMGDREVRIRFGAVLGRLGFLDHFEVALDNDHLVLTRVGPLRRWWRRLLRGIQGWFGMIAGPEDPL
jgi:hypothetical protein